MPSCSHEDAVYADITKTSYFIVHFKSPWILNEMYVLEYDMLGGCLVYDPYLFFELYDVSMNFQSSSNHTLLPPPTITLKSKVPTMLISNCPTIPFVNVLHITGLLLSVTVPGRHVIFLWIWMKVVKWQTFVLYLLLNYCPSLITAKKFEKTKTFERKALNQSELPSRADKSIQPRHIGNYRKYGEKRTLSNTFNDCYIESVILNSEHSRRI